MASEVALNGTYAYNSLGQRVSSTTAGVTTQYVIDPAGLGNVVGQYTGGTLAANYIYGIGLTSQKTTGGSYFYDFDSLGSTVGVSNNSGAYLNKYSYSPFGDSFNTSSSLTNPFQYVGQWGAMIGANSLDTMRARSFSPSLGRFTTQDPLGLGGGNSNGSSRISVGKISQFRQHARQNLEP